MVQQARITWYERGREATRLRILDAARELFARDGVDATSVRSIAERCGLSGAAIYYYYPAKADILEALLVMPPVEAMGRAANGIGSRAGFLDELAGFFSAWAENADLLRVLLAGGFEGNAATMSFSAGIQGAVEAGLDAHIRGLFGDELAKLPHAICMLICGLMYDTLLASGDDFAAVVAQPAFRQRVVALLALVLPQDPL